MIKNFGSKLVFQCNIEQDYLSKSVKKNFLYVFNQIINSNTESTEKSIIYDFFFLIIYSSKNYKKHASEKRNQHQNIHLSIRVHVFFIDNTFVSNPRLKLPESKQKRSNILRLNFCYLKIICFLNPRYFPKTIEYILKNVQKTSASVLMMLYD